MKVLVVGKSNQLYWPHHVSSALSDLGCSHELFLFNECGYVKDFAISITKRFHKGHSENLLGYIFSQKLKSFQPDIVILVSAFFIPKVLYHILDGFNPKPYVIGWSGDSFDNSVLFQINMIDKLYVTDSFFVERAKKEYSLKNVDYLPLAYNPKIFFPIEANDEKKHQIVFVGNSAQDRCELLKEMRSPIDLVGSRWDDDVLKKHKLLARSLSQKGLVKLYQSSHAVLNMKQGVNVVNGLNMRSFEAPACGALMIHDDVKDLELCFNKNEHLLVYKNRDELDMILKELCVNPKQFDQVSLSCQQYIAKHHTYKHRMLLVLDSLL